MALPQGRKVYQNSKWIFGLWIFLLAFLAPTPFRIINGAIGSQGEGILNHSLRPNFNNNRLMFSFSFFKKSSLLCSGGNDKNNIKSESKIEDSNGGRKSFPGMSSFFPHSMKGKSSLIQDVKASRKNFVGSFFALASSDGNNNGSLDAENDDNFECKNLVFTSKKDVAKTHLETYTKYKEKLEVLKKNQDEEKKIEYTEFKMAEYAVRYLRAMTNANAVMVDGLSESKENVKLWKTYAPDAYTILKKYYKKQAKEIKNNTSLANVHLLMAEAFTYSTSSKGILKAAVSGDGYTFIKLVDELIKKYPDFDKGVAYIYKGAFYLAAPWPLKSIDTASKAIQKAFELEPKSIRNNYYQGISKFYQGDYKDSLAYFENAIDKEKTAPLAPSEFEVQEFFVEESKRAIGIVQSKLTTK